MAANSPHSKPVEAEDWSQRTHDDLNGFTPDTNGLLGRNVYKPIDGKVQPPLDNEMLTVITSTPRMAMLSDATLSPFWKLNDRPKADRPRRRSLTLSGSRPEAKEMTDRRPMKNVSASSKRTASRSEQIRSLDRSLSDSDSLSELSFLDQESPITNRIRSPTIQDGPSTSTTSDESSRLISNQSSSCLLCPDDSGADQSTQQQNSTSRNMSVVSSPAHLLPVHMKQMSPDDHSKADQLWFDVPITSTEEATPRDVRADACVPYSYVNLGISKSAVFDKAEPERQQQQQSKELTTKTGKSCDYVLLSFTPEQVDERRLPPGERCICGQFDWKRASADSIEMLGKDLTSQRIVAKSLMKFAIQVMIPLGICGFGNMAAGLLLDRVQQLRVFTVLNELYIAIPCLMGLKGNLEMTMASRLSTAVSSFEPNYKSID